MDKLAIILKPGLDLKGKDLTPAYRHFNLSHDLPDNPAMFKKKEPLQNMAKSILKHRIQNLTDKSVACIENEIDYTSPDGTGLTVEMLRRLAHFLILQASGELEELPEPQHIQPKLIESTPGKRKRPLKNDDDESVIEKEPLIKKTKKGDSKTLDRMTDSPGSRSTRATRKSLAPEVLRNATLKKDNSKIIGETTVKEENIACRFKGSSKKSIVTDNIESNESDDMNNIAELNLGPNPTPQMIARKRRSLAITTKSSITTPSKSNQTLTNSVNVKSQKSSQPMTQTNGTNTIDNVPIQHNEEKTHESGVKTIPVSPSTYYSPGSSPRKSMISPRKQIPPSIGYPGSGQNEIFIAESDTSTIKYEDVKKQIKNFAGANLTVLHTPFNWGALEVFSLVMSIRQMNRKANVTTFSILVGCGLDSIHLFHEALSRQTKHVQFVVFEREDKNLEQPSQLLRDVNSFFLLAYFFPNCDNEDQSKVDIPQLVRSGSTTCFHTKSNEDLENNIVHSLSEEGDWIIDLCCAGRELSLAAQKMGRNAIAMHEDPKSLHGLHEKASAIARHHDPNFRIGTDGVILKLNKM